MNEMHESNRTKWNAAAPRWKARREAYGWGSSHWRRHHSLYPEAIEHINHHLGALEGKNAIVLGSGDNYAAFALAEMGANVTSVDISERQLEIASERAKVLGLEIDFHQGDLSNLSTLPEGGYHFACSVAIVAIWISDLWKYYAEASRLLAPGGLLQIGEAHPISHLLHNVERFTGENAMTPEEGGDNPVFDHHYFDHGPHRYSYDPTYGAMLRFIDPKDGSASDHVQYQSHWTVSDYLMAMIDSGFEILHVRETTSRNLERWRENRFHALPRGLHIIGQKKAPERDPSLIEGSNS